MSDHAARDSVDGKLSLIEEQDFEDWLATATEVHKLDEMYRARLGPSLRAQRSKPVELSAKHDRVVKPSLIY